LSVHVLRKILTFTLVAVAEHLLTATVREAKVRVEHHFMGRVLNASACVVASLPLMFCRSPAQMMRELRASRKIFDQTHHVQFWDPSLAEDRFEVLIVEYVAPFWVYPPTLVT